LLWGVIVETEAYGARAEANGLHHGNSNYLLLLLLIYASIKSQMTGTK